MTNATSVQHNESSAKTLTFMIYGLYAVASFLGFTAFIAIVLNYLKKSDVKGTPMESHFRWQINTFWFSLLWFLVGTVLLFIMFPIALLVYFGNVIWIIYRIVRGCMTLYNDKPMYG